MVRNSWPHYIQYDAVSETFFVWSSVTGYFKDMRIPYYIDRINGSYYMTCHEGKNNVYKFNVVEDRIVDVVTVH